MCSDLRYENCANKTFLFNISERLHTKPPLNVAMKFPSECQATYPPYKARPLPELLMLVHELKILIWHSGKAIIRR